MKSNMRLYGTNSRRLHCKRSLRLKLKNGRKLLNRIREEARKIGYGNAGYFDKYEHYIEVENAIKFNKKLLRDEPMDTIKSTEDSRHPVIMQGLRVIILLELTFVAYHFYTALVM